MVFQVTFDVAEKMLGVYKIIDADDVVENCDEKSIMTYVAQYLTLQNNFNKVGHLMTRAGVFRCY